MASPSSVNYGKDAYNDFLLYSVQEDPDSALAQSYKSSIENNITQGGLKAFQEMNELLSKTKPETLAKFKDKSFHSAISFVKSQMVKLGGKEDLLPVFDAKTDRKLFLAEWTEKVQQTFKAMSHRIGVGPGGPVSPAPSVAPEVEIKQKHEMEVKEKGDRVFAKETITDLTNFLNVIITDLENKIEAYASEKEPRYTKIIQGIRAILDEALRSLSKEPITKNEIKGALSLAKESLIHLLVNNLNISEIWSLNMPLFVIEGRDLLPAFMKKFNIHRPWMQSPSLEFELSPGVKIKSNPEGFFNYFEKFQTRIIDEKQLQKYKDEKNIKEIGNFIINCITQNYFPDLALKALAEMLYISPSDWNYQLFTDRVMTCYLSPVSDPEDVLKAIDIAEKMQNRIDNPKDSFKLSENESVHAMLMPRIDEEDKNYEDKLKKILDHCVQRNRLVKIFDYFNPKIDDLFYQEKKYKLLGILLFYGFNVPHNTFLKKQFPDLWKIIDGAIKLRQDSYEKLVAGEIIHSILPSRDVRGLIAQYASPPSIEELTPEDTIVLASKCLERVKSGDIRLSSDSFS